MIAIDVCCDKCGVSELYIERGEKIPNCECGKKRYRVFVTAPAVNIADYHKAVNHNNKGQAEYKSWRNSEETKKKLESGEYRVPTPQEVRNMTNASDDGLEKYRRTSAHSKKLAGLLDDAHQEAGAIADQVGWDGQKMHQIADQLKEQRLAKKGEKAQKAETARAVLKEKVSASKERGKTLSN